MSRPFGQANGWYAAITTAEFAGPRFALEAGTNDLYNVGACTAGPGHDTASGWGSIDFGAVADYFTITVKAAP